jgi:tetratricopeptide (TPR) repeat protein
VASCAACLKAICDICVVYRKTLPHCPSCVRRARRVQTLIGASLATLVIAGIAAGGLYLALRKPPFDYGKHATKVKELKAKLADEPCHRPNARAYADALLDAGDSRGLLAFVDGFITRCGDWHRLRWFNYSAHKQLSDFAGAAADATRLIEDHPEDQDFWWWRGQAWQQLGKHDDAIADFRQSHVLMPRANYIPFDLSALLEKQGRPCEAITPVEIYLNHHQDHRESPLVVERLERLTGLCPTFYGQGVTSVRVSDDGFAREPKSKIGDEKVPATIDWSAPMTTVGANLAKKLGLPESGAKLRVGGRGGYLVTLPSLSVGLASAQNVEAVVLPSSAERPELTVGLTFLSRFVFSDDGERLVIRQR